MNPDQLWDTTMDPDKRSLIKVNITDAALAEKELVCLWEMRLNREKNGLKKM